MKKSDNYSDFFHIDVFGRTKSWSSAWPHNLALPLISSKDYLKSVSQLIPWQLLSHNSHTSKLLQYRFSPLLAVDRNKNIGLDVKIQILLRNYKNQTQETGTYFQTQYNRFQNCKFNKLKKSNIFSPNILASGNSVSNFNHVLRINSCLTTNFLKILDN